MNEHFGKDDTMAEMTTEEGVALLAERFAAVEEAIVALARAIPKGLAAVRDGGHIGGIECMQYTAQGGMTVNRALEDVADLHQQWTQIAQDKGIDLPVIASGGR